MRAFVCEIDQTGLRRLISEEFVPRGVRPWLARTSAPMTVIWALLAEDDAEAIRTEVAAARPEHACGLLLNRAVELISLAAAGSPAVWSAQN